MGIGTLVGRVTPCAPQSLCGRAAGRGLPALPRFVPVVIEKWYEFIESRRSIFPRSDDGKGAHLHTATNKVALFRKERRIYPAGHSIKRARCRMNAAFRRSVQVRPWERVKTLILHATLQSRIHGQLQRGAFGHHHQNTRLPRLWNAGFIRQAENRVWGCRINAAFRWQGHKLHPCITQGIHSNVQTVASAKLIHGSIHSTATAYGEPNWKTR